MIKRLSRRTLLRGAAGVGIGLPFLEAMVPRTASGATPVLPKRNLEDTGYLKSFPHLGASVFGFEGSERDALEEATRRAKLVHIRHGGAGIGRRLPQRHAGFQQAVPIKAGVFSQLPAKIPQMPLDGEVGKMAEQDLGGLGRFV